MQQAVQAAAWSCELLVSRLRRAKAGPLGAGNAARRRVRRIVGMGLPCHDGEVEGVVVEDDAVLVLGIRGRACYAQAHVPTRRSHHRVPRLLQGWLSRHAELVGLLGSAVDFFQESYH